MVFASVAPCKLSVAVAGWPAVGGDRVISKQPVRKGCREYLCWRETAEEHGQAGHHFRRRPVVIRKGQRQIRHLRHILAGFSNDCMTLSASATRTILSRSSVPSCSENTPSEFISVSSDRARSHSGLVMFFTYSPQLSAPVEGGDAVHDGASGCHQSRGSLGRLPSRPGSRRGGNHRLNASEAITHARPRCPCQGYRNVAVACV